VTRRLRRLVQTGLAVIVIAAGGLAASGSALAQQAPATTVAPTTGAAPTDTSGSSGSVNSIVDSLGAATGVGTATTTPGPVITVPGVSAPTVPGVTNSDTDIVTIATPKKASSSVLIIVLVTLISVVPSLLMLTTTFPRFLIVLGLTRQALGLQGTPPNQVLAGLAAFLTLFVMGPTFSKINDTAIQPASRGEITTSQALNLGWAPMRDFMLDRTRSSDLDMLFGLVGEKKPDVPAKLSPRFVIPAFILSELRAAFLIGFLIWVPFLLIDLIVSSVLAALGMMMMPPVVVSLPVKLALFVLVDGWALVAGSLLKSAAV